MTSDRRSVPTSGYSLFRRVAVRVLEILLGRLRTEEETPAPAPATAVAPPSLSSVPMRARIIEVHRVDGIVCVEADAIEDEFRELIHGLELHDGCGDRGCPHCSRSGHTTPDRYLN